MSYLDSFSQPGSGRGAPCARPGKEGFETIGYLNFPFSQGSP
jgi:hypothetical protein